MPQRFCAQEISHVLEQCGGDVEATIRRLDELSLSAARAAAGVHTGAGPSGAQQPHAGARPRL
jgi:hypothetical protein